MTATEIHAPWFKPEELYWFNEGTYQDVHRKFGSHCAPQDGHYGTHFAVWAPAATEVSVIGDFNYWNPSANPLERISPSGVWTGFVKNVAHGALYKYHVVDPRHPSGVDIADPHAFYHEILPRTASLVWDLEYRWNDTAWMQGRPRRQADDQPLAIYEVHFASWMRVPEEQNRPLTYLEFAKKLAEHVLQLNFTHVQFLPLMEHGDETNLGYDTIGFFAPSSRFGTPQELMGLIDYLHQRNIGVILEWTPAGLLAARNEAAELAWFGPDNAPRIDTPEAQSFLVSSALFWLEKYHADGLKITWGPTLSSTEAVRELNHCIQDAISAHHPEAIIIGDSGYRFVPATKLVHGLLEFVGTEVDRRAFRAQGLTADMEPSVSPGMIVSMNHEQTPPFQNSLLSRMGGDEGQKFANLRLFLAGIYAWPGAKLLFMGGEFGQWQAWNPNTSLDWHLLNAPDHRHGELKQWVANLNELYRREAALRARAGHLASCEWLTGPEAGENGLSILRPDGEADDALLIVLNFSPAPRQNVRVGIPQDGVWLELLNSDAREYGGAGQGNLGGVEASPLGWQSQPRSLSLTLPPLGAIFLKRNP